MEAIIIIVVLWLVLQLIGGTAGKAAQQAVDNAETPAWITQRQAADAAEHEF